jgi:hypothetical protein
MGMMQTAVSLRAALDDYELMDCIENGLNRFGPGIKYAVMWRMVVLKESPKEGIPTRPEALHTALQSIFGQGSKRIEDAIIEEIRSRTGDHFSEIDDFVDLLKSVRSASLQFQFR